MKKKSTRRRGSALVIVLGILAVMMLMAVAFSTFVRTERGGSTNLKNAFVARTSLFTAVGRAMEAIDLSFGSATNDDPVAAWPQPWLASAEGGDKFQSAALGDGETAGAHVLTDKIAKHLTPAQLALARSARCNWAPIYSSINASSANSGRNGGSYGNYGRPTEDSLIGRYAFIALDTTGLLDMNQTGRYPDDRSENSGDPMTFDLPAGTAQVTVGNRSVAAPPFVVDPDAFVTKRENANLFHSMADAKTLCGKSVLAIDETKAPANGGAKPATAGEFFPADLFAGFAPSLSETNPEGNPKIHLPSGSEFNRWSAGRVQNLLSRVYRAMVGVFARSRAVAGISPGNADSDLMTIFQSVPGAEYQLSPAALATVSLMDGLDDDNVPGTCDKQSLEYWKVLPSVSVKVEGDTVSDTMPPRTSIYNFPCTESAPLLDAVRAEITFDSGVDNQNADWTQRTITYTGTIKVSAHAHCQNRTSKANPHHSKIKVEWEVMKGAPLGNTISYDDGTEIRDSLELVGSTGGGGGGGGGRPGSGGGGDSGQTKLIDWSGFFEKNGSITKGSNEAEADLEDSSDGGSRVLTVDSEVGGLTVVCHFYTNAVSSGGGGGSGGGGRPGSGGSGGSTVIETKPYPMTAAEWNGGQVNKGVSDVFIPIRIKVTITDSNGSIQQQVPAPALESAKSKGYWIRVNPGVYHNPGDTDASKVSKYGGSKGDSSDLAYGWAFCAVPTFAFDTTSLLNAGNYMNFWVGDEMARAASDQAGGGGRPGQGGQGGGSTMFSALKSKFWTNGDSATPNQTIKNAMAGPRGQYIWGHLQKEFLFNDASGNYTDKVTTWMSTGGGRAPDMLHSASHGGDPFVSPNGSDVSADNRAQELYTRFPANGEGYASVADLGRVMCGPYETLSLFKTWRPMGGRADFHPVVDYFTTDEDRYPKQSDVDAQTASDGTVNWTALGQGGKDLYSAVHNGRVNLNAPYLVELTKNGGKRGRKSGNLNPYPIAAALSGAPYPTAGGGTNQISPQKALVFASTICKMIEDSDLDEMKISSEVWGTSRKGVRNLSFLGMGQDTQNTFLSDIIGLAHPQTDAQREGILHGISDAFTTRGQTYLLIIRADAYSPKFGENDSVQDGTTLATTHAIVELFRDPVPAHGPDGVLLPSDGEGPVAYHNWYIRSFRVF